ncbi:enoyl-CoA hydratase/isomerase family protein [Nocardia sp. NPDC051463]|uniref:enoyl-CoA hydratase/isomerase family protein n=1 Tax=Nocardia sp. NPDC051463 TaxID=3154845 RepID=UPI0034184C38
MPLIEIDDVDRVRIVTLASDKPTNPIPRRTGEALVKALREADADDNLDAIVVTGGIDRSFSAGGDFNEVRLLTTDDRVNDLISWYIDFFLGVLDTSKPTIAAIDHHAIGVGCQLAMMFDWKMMSNRADMRLPELEHGLGASVGAVVFATACSYDVSRHIVMSTQPISADEALRKGIVDEVCEPEFLLDRALQRAKRMGQYPRAAFSGTKRVLTNSLRTALENTREESLAVHREAFRARAMHKHFDNVLGTHN